MIDATAGVDRGPIRSDLAGDPDYHELLQLFAEEIPRKRQAVRELRREGRLADLAVFAHQLKGAAGGYGFGGLSEAAAVLEVACRSNDLDRMDVAVDAIVDYLDRIQVSPSGPSSR
jgi:HPt (histidine-containing phosphotransfer) domain-containing protein